MRRYVSSGQPQYGLDKKGLYDSKPIRYLPLIPYLLRFAAKYFITVKAFSHMIHPHFVSFTLLLFFITSLLYMRSFHLNDQGPHTLGIFLPLNP